MAEATSRLELKEYALRKMGFPVIDINVADTQLEDRIDDAIQYFNEWHYEGTYKMYLKHQLTASTIRFDAPIPADSYRMGDTVKGETSLAQAIVHAQSTDNLSVLVWKTTGAFQAGENLVGTLSTNQISTNATTFWEIGDMDQQYIDIPNHIMSVLSIFPISSTQTSNFLFDPVYYYAFDLMFTFGGLDLISYELMKQRINQINNTFSGQKPVRFNRNMGKLFIDWDWTRTAAPGRWIVVECYRLLDPNEYSSVWNNFFLKEYVYALFMIQWGNNLSKFASIQLPGGVTLDGPRILEIGEKLKTELEEQMKAGRWSEPMGFRIG
jgi:hypothetical protein